jgi:ribose transport system permease protein
MHKRQERVETTEIIDIIDQRRQGLRAIEAAEPRGHDSGEVLAEVAKPEVAWRTVLARYAMIGILALMVVGFSLASPEYFFTYRNIVMLLVTQSVLAILVIAMLGPLIVGQFDLSVASIVGLTHVIFVQLAVAGVPIVLAILISTLVGTCIGIINALLVVRVGINALITTLGMATLVYGVVLLDTGGRSIQSNIPDSLLAVARTRVFDIPVSVFYMVAICVVAWYFYERTPPGRKMYAIGGSQEAARLAGINVNRLTTFAFVLSGTLAGFAGVITASRIGVAQPDVGQSYLLPAFAAAFLGAAAIKPGTFNVLGSVVAIFTLGVGVNGMQLLGAPFWIEPMFSGGSLIVAVALTRYLQREAL